MHNLFLGLVKEHFRNVIGIGRSKTDEGAVMFIEFSEPPPDFTEPEHKSLGKLRRVLQKPLNDKIQSSPESVKKTLTRLHHRALAFACDELEVDEEKSFMSDEGKALYSKDVCATNILSWRVEQTEYRDEGVDTATRLGQVLTDEEMVEIWSDLARISTPTWVTPIPLDLGSSSHGKLKADQWSTLGITHLTLSLIRLWGLRESRDPRTAVAKVQGAAGRYHIAHVGCYSSVFPRHFTFNRSCISYLHESLYGRDQETLSSV